MYYVYLLKSVKTHKLYVGSTPDLRRRFIQHNAGKNLSTKSGVPWQLLYYEAFPAKHLALERERKLKRYGRGMVALKERLGLR